MTPATSRGSDSFIWPPPRETNTLIHINTNKIELYKISKG